MLTDKEVYKIFSWQPYREDWIVDRNQVDDRINFYYGDLIKSIAENDSFDTYLSEDGGLGNYLGFICYPSGQKEYNGNAILVCVSLCSPYAAYGQITIYKQQKCFGCGSIFNPEKAYDISDPDLTEIECELKIILENNKLVLLDIEFLSKQLPDEVAKSMEFENHNEGTLYLHGIFQKTD